MDALLNDLEGVQLVELVMLCIIMVLGCFACYTDIRSREIGHLSTWGLLVAGLAGQLGFWGLGQTTPERIALTLLSGLGLSGLIYAYGMWAAGDARLFWGSVVALPPTLFSTDSFFSFDAPLWALVVNTMLANLAILLVAALFRRSAEKRLAWTALADPQGWLQQGAEIAGLAGLVLSAGGISTWPLSFEEAGMLLVVGYLLIDRFVPKGYRVLLALPGWVLGVCITWYSGAWTIYLALWAFGWSVAALHRLVRQRYAGGVVRAEGEHIEVELTQPFAPPIVLGVVITAVLGGSIVAPMRALVQVWIEGGG